MDDEHPEWLPSDWKVCVRVRSSGRKDKYYVNPLNGIKFNSKPEVIRYLKEAEDDQKLKEPNKTISQGTDAEKLPSGWTKEIKITKKGGKTRKDPYYVDPVSGLHFRSIQEVNHYLETKDSGEAESKEDDTNHPTEELKDHSKSSTVVAEEQMLIDSKEDEILAGNESIKSVENSNSLVTNTIGQGEEKDSVGADQKQEKVTPQNKRKKSNHKWMSELPRRTSKRLARMEVDSPLEVETSNGGTEAAAPEKAQVNTIENAGKSEINTSGGFSKQKEPIKDVSSVEEQHEASIGAEISTIINTSGKPEINTSGDFSKLKEPMKDVSSVEEQHEASVGAEISTIINTSGKSETDISGDFGKQKEVTTEDEKNGKDLNSSLNDILMDPCIEFAIKMLTDAIPLEDVQKVHNNRTSGSSSASTVGDIWADPCFEFAVKTLTSEIPTEDGRNNITK